MYLTDSELSIVQAHQPVNRPQKSLMQAAVAIILRDGPNGTEFLMMQRAKHESDPWSGQMSFPGGKIDPQDSSSKAAAIREAEEEVGLLLNEQDYIGQLDDFYGLKVNDQYSVHVACYVFKPQGEIQLRANHEVEDMVWVSMSFLNEPANSHRYFHPKDVSTKMPAVLIDEGKEQILWGLSLRMLSVFYELIGRTLGVLSEEDYAAMLEIEKRNIKSKKFEQFATNAMNPERQKSR